jgi:hypothetical protein
MPKKATKVRTMPNCHYSISPMFVLIVIHHPTYNNAVIPYRNYLRRLSVCNCFIVLVFLQLTIVAFSLPLCKVINRPPLAVASLSNFAICKNAVLM